MKPLRLALLGFGTVGQWLAEALHTRRAWLQHEYGVAMTLISVGTAHHGLISRSEGLDIPTLLDLAATRQPLTAHPAVTHWANILEGLEATGGDVLVEATGATLRNAEPGMSYIRTALAQGMHVVTSSKGPVALAGRDLLALARAQGVQLRMESTVMSGTPVLSTIREGMAGTSIRAICGLLNGTVNSILSAMALGQSYAEALAQAQAQGYAEATADQESSHTHLEARVEPIALPLADPLARVDGLLNAVVIRTDTPTEVTVIGPGAGRFQADQGVLADLIAIATS